MASFIKCVPNADNDYERKNIWRFIRGNTSWSSPTIQPCITLWFSEGQKQLWMRRCKEMKVVLGKFYQPIAVAASGVLCKQLLSKNIAPFKVVNQCTCFTFYIVRRKGSTMPHKTIPPLKSSWLKKIVMPEEENKLASSKLRFRVRNYESLTHWLTDGGEV